MQNNGTSVLDRPEVSHTSPVVGRPVWVDSWDEARYPLTLRIEFPMSPALMVAALYRAGKFLRADDISDAADLWTNVAYALMEDGYALFDYADDLGKDIERGRVEHPEWLAHVRQRVAEVTAR